MKAKTVLIQEYNPTFKLDFFLSKGFVIDLSDCFLLLKKENVSCIYDSESKVQMICIKDYCGLKFQFFSSGRGSCFGKVFRDFDCRKVLHDFSVFFIEPCLKPV